MTSTEAVVRRMFALIDERRWADLALLYDDAVVYHRPGYEPIQGRDNLLSFYRHVRRIKDGAHTVERVIAQESHGACWGHFVGMSLEGAQLAVDFAEWYRLAGGRIVDRRTFFDRPAV